MNFLDFLLSVVSLFSSSSYFAFWFPFLITLAFVATVPAIVRSFTSWR